MGTAEFLSGIRLQQESHTVSPASNACSVRSRSTAALSKLSGVEVFRIGYEEVRRAKSELAGDSEGVGITDVHYGHYQPILRNWFSK